MRVEPNRPRALERQPNVKPKRMTSDPIARKFAKRGVDLRSHLDCRMLLLSRVVGLVTLLLALFLFAVWCRSRARVRRRLGRARGFAVAFIVVGFEERRDALLLVFRIERVRWDVVDIDWVGIERPQERLN